MRQPLLYSLICVQIGPGPHRSGCRCDAGSQSWIHSSSTDDFRYQFAGRQICQRRAPTVARPVRMPQPVVFSVIGRSHQSFFANVGHSDQPPFHKNGRIVVKLVAVAVNFKTDLIIDRKNVPFTSGHGYPKIQAPIYKTERKWNGVWPAIGMRQGQPADKGVIQHVGDLVVTHGNHKILSLKNFVWKQNASLESGAAGVNAATWSPQESHHGNA